MTTKEMIQAEIEKLSEDELRKLYDVVRDIKQSKAGQSRGSYLPGRIR